MDLFHMRRYQPAEDEVVSAPVETAENKSSILRKLKAKLQSSAPAEPSKDRKESQDNDQEEKPQESQSPTKAKKKKKKKRRAEENGSEGFTVLGDHLLPSKNKVRRVLPTWLAQPDIVSASFGTDQLAVTDLPGLDDDLVKRLEANGVEHFFPVQKQVIPHLLPQPWTRVFRPSDICVSAPTGSGKTLAFVLPIVQALKGRIVPKVRALIVLPVQDLAAQVYKVFKAYCEGTSLRVKLLSAQKSFSQEQSELVHRSLAGDAWHSLVDIIVATPGRLVDHIQKTNGFSLLALRYIVIDEADRVMEDIQNDWLSHVENAVYASPKRPQPGATNLASLDAGAMPLQKLLFSATLSQNPEQLQQLNLFEPKLFTSIVKPPVKSDEKSFDFVGQYTTPAELTEAYAICHDSLKKPLVLYQLLQAHSAGKKTLVFTKSLEHTHFLCILLKEYGLNVGELSSQMKSNRSSVLNKFTAGHLDVLVCSDALARGIDIGHCDLVISYDCPPYVKTYIHRVGRTARAGRAGMAITIVESEAKEERRLQGLMKEAGKVWANIATLAIDEVDLNEDLHNKALVAAKKVIEVEKQIKQTKKSSAKRKSKK